MTVSWIFSSRRSRLVRDFIFSTAPRVSSLQFRWSSGQPLQRGLAGSPAVYHHSDAVPLMPALPYGTLYAELCAQVLGKHDLIMRRALGREGDAQR